MLLVENLEHMRIFKFKKIPLHPNPTIVNILDFSLLVSAYTVKFY